MKRFWYQIILYQIILCAPIYTNEIKSQPTNTSNQNESEDIFITVIAAGQQSMTVQNPEKQCTLCQNLAGAQLKECLFYLRDDDFKKEFFGMHYRARYLYLMSINRNGYRSLLNRFHSEQEWHAHRSKLTTTEKQYLPATLKEQYAVLENAPNLPNYYWELFDCFMRPYKHNCMEETIEYNYYLLKEKLLKQYEHINEAATDTGKQA